VYHEGSRFSLEIRWDPKKRGIIRTEYPCTLSRKDADKYRATALKLLQVEQRGRRRGPDSFKDAQEFEDIVVHLIQTAHRKGMATKQDRIATWLQPVLTRRRRDTGSAASVEVNLDSTQRLIRKHIPCLWDDLVKKALQST
jgi:hypothetical protein